MPVRPEIEAAIRRAAERMVTDLLTLLAEHGAIAEAAAAEPRPRVRRRAQNLERLAAEVLAALAQRDGVSVGAIARDLGAAARELTRPLTWLLARGQVRRTGERRGARYFLVEAAPARRARKRPARARPRGETERRKAEARPRLVPERRAPRKDKARPAPAPRAQQSSRKGRRAPRRKR
jgi:DNA-binding MarR family transcriptional regulator